MGDQTGISWTDATWNPVRGCSRVSEGCRNCYAERTAARFCGPGQPYHGLVKLVRHERLVARRGGAIEGQVRFDAHWNGVVRLVPEHLADPLKWRRPRRIFVNSMSDLFHEALTNEQIAAVFGVMAAAPQHTFQVLTKRATRMREWFRWASQEQADAVGTCMREALMLLGPHDTDLGRPPERWPLSNVWLGVSVEDQSAADQRIPVLLQTPAVLRFLSCEPLLGPLDLVDHLMGYQDDDVTGGGHVRLPHTTPYIHQPVKVGWVIVGCESGPGARRCEVDWLRAIRDQCARAGQPMFLKQAEDRSRTPAAMNGVAIDYRNAIEVGIGSKRKAGGVIELPYLDGVQHAAFPEVRRG